jgi:cobalt/nickel transport system permease protein
MRLDLLERSARLDGPLQRLDARLTLTVTLAFVVAVVVTPPGRWAALSAEGLLLAFWAGLSGEAPGTLFRRWLSFSPLVLFLAAMIALSHPQRAELGLAGVAGSILVKNSMALVMVLVLGSVTPFPRLLGGMRKLGVPPVLVATLHFMYRYVHVLGDEANRMIQARRARTFRRSGQLDWGLLTGLLGILFLRAFERGERVHAAMLARGWDGVFRSLDDSEVWTDAPR